MLSHRPRPARTEPFPASPEVTGDVRVGAAHPKAWASGPRVRATLTPVEVFVIDGRDEKHGALHALIEVLGEVLPAFAMLTEQPAADPLLTAFAGLARARRLLVGADEMSHLGHADLVGVFVRPCWEMWMTSLYILWIEGGFERAKATSRKHVAGLNRRTQLGLSIDHWPEDNRETKVWEMVESLTPQFEERGLPADFPRKSYDLLFAAHSNLDSHGGLSASKDHVEEISPGKCKILLDRKQAWVGGHTPICVMTTLVLHLTEVLYADTGVDLRRLDPIREGLGHVAKLDGWNFGSADGPDENDGAAVTVG
jgi:hypothetical protein